MKIPRPKTALSALIAIFAIFYIAVAFRVATYDNTAPEPTLPPSSVATIAIFGASGTAGDGILKAALASPHVEEIKVITRRLTPRIQAGVDAGKVDSTIHMDYLDYSAVRDKLADVDAVFWAIGLSSVGVDEETYRKIHVAFPRQLVEEWQSVSVKPATSFHYLSSSDISEDSGAMWARVKVEAENTLFRLANGSDYIRPTREESHLGQDLLYWFFSPVGAAVKATEIGQAMIEAELRGEEFANGDKLSTLGILRYSKAYEQR